MIINKPTTHRVLLSIIFSMVICPVGNCQSLSPVEINAAGLEVASGNYSLSYSIGGAITTTIGNGINILTQGYQQPNIYVVTSIQSIGYGNAVISVFPNPTRGILNIKLSNISTAETCNIGITNALGINCSLSREYFEFANNREVTLDIGDLKLGVYFFSLISKKDNSQVAFFRVVKIN